MKVMAFNTDDAVVSTKDGTVLEVVEDFKYLGTYIGSNRERAEGMEGTGMEHTAQHEEGVEV